MIFSPAFFPDIVPMLRSLRSNILLENLATAKISLMEFLTITDDRLEELGAAYPFQRNRIMYGLHKFHLKPWSIHTVQTINPNITTFELFYILAGYLKQMLVLECTLTYVSRHEFTHSRKTKDALERIAYDLQDIRRAAQQIRSIAITVSQSLTTRQRTAQHSALHVTNYRLNGRQSILLHFWFLEIFCHQNHSAEVLTLL